MKVKNRSPILIMVQPPTLMLPKIPEILDGGIIDDALALDLICGG